MSTLRTITVDTAKLTKADIEGAIKNSIYYQPEGTQITICVLVLTNGFTTVGQSGCINPADFDADIGKQMAYRDAEDSIWRLEGYLRKQALYAGQSLDVPVSDTATAQPPASLLIEIPPVVVGVHDDLTTFLGVKIVNAKPMTRLVYSQFRGWDLPPDENGDDAGYLVEYTDAQRPNVSGYQGYVSWSPKDVFEQAYHAYNPATPAPAPAPIAEDLGDAKLTGTIQDAPLPFSG